MNWGLGKGLRGFGFKRVRGLNLKIGKFPRRGGV